MACFPTILRQCDLSLLSMNGSIPMLVMFMHGDKSFNNMSQKCYYIYLNRCAYLFQIILTEQSDLGILNVLKFLPFFDKDLNETG